MLHKTCLLCIVVAVYASEMPSDNQRENSTINGYLLQNFGQCALDMNDYFLDVFNYSQNIFEDSILQEKETETDEFFYHMFERLKYRVLFYAYEKQISLKNFTEEVLCLRRVQSTAMQAQKRLGGNCSTTDMRMMFTTFAQYCLLESDDVFLLCSICQKKFIMNILFYGHQHIFNMYPGERNCSSVTNLLSDYLEMYSTSPTGEDLPMCEAKIFRSLRTVPNNTAGGWIVNRA